MEIIAPVSVCAVPILSIVIVAYKSRDEIRACLKSLPPSLAGGSVEAIVVDNSPGDGTDVIVRNEFPGVRYIPAEENLGFGKANNLGFSQSTGGAEFVLFLNPDTVCNDAALTHCIERLAKEPAIGMISPKLVLNDGSMDLASRRSIPTLWDGFCRATGLAKSFPRSKLFSGYNLTYLPEDGTYDVGAINGAFMMGRRAVFEAVAGPAEAESGIGQVESSELRVESQQLNADSLPLTAIRAPHARVFDERFFMYGDDLDLCIRVSKAGYRIVYEGRVQITHVKGVSVAKEYDRMARAIFDANRDVYLKHFNPRGSVLLKWKYYATFGCWKHIAQIRAKLKRHRQVRPL